MNTYTSRNAPSLIPAPLSDAYVFTGEIPPIHTYIPPIDTLDQGLSWTGVMKALDKGAQMPAERPSRIPRVPVWSLALIVSGVTLMAFGWVLNGPMSALIYGVIPR